ncbi:MAG: hypothetical protein Devi2KO_35970 [Devosia indica]
MHGGAGKLGRLKCCNGHGLAAQTLNFIAFDSVYLRGYELAATSHCLTGKVRGGITNIHSRPDDQEGKGKPKYRAQQKHVVQVHRGR